MGSKSPGKGFRRVLPKVQGQTVGGEMTKFYRVQIQWRK